MVRSGDAVAVDLPVLSVGNLTAGGTGKTPVVAMLLAELKKRGRRPVVLSRGYGARGDGPNDEAQVLSRSHGDVIHLQGKDRLALARRAAGAKLGDVIVLDDGFQHLSLHRDLNICCIDATNPFGHGAVLPRGLLREPMASLYRARPVLITRAELAPAGRLDEIRSEVLRWNEHARFVVSEMRLSGTTNVEGGEPADASELAGKRVFCASGVGNPAAFAANVRTTGARVVGRMDFDDHHDWTEADVKAVCARATELAAEVVVTTAKDAVKLQSADWGRSAPAVRVLEVEASVRADDAALWGKLIDEALTRK
jgi:tetraacyldisaccharide 4'-kinase